MCGLAHQFESAGIPTVAIALIPQHAERIAPPRALAVPFVLGRPLGSPSNPGLQHRVLDAALGLLTRSDSNPVLQTFEEDVPESHSTEEAWVCPVSFATPETSSSTSDQVIDEIALLQPWYDRGLEERSGRTSFGLTGMTLVETVTFLTQFTSDVPPSGEAEKLKLAAEDLKAFYNESAASQPGHQTAKSVEDWYWQQTQAGTLIKAIKQNCAKSEDKSLKLTASFLLVPEAQSR